MGKIIACVNQKGGVGKTTVTINLGIGLADAGKKVLLIDFDPQGSMTDCLGFPEPDEMTITVANVIMNTINEIPMEKGYAVLRHPEGVDVLPANIELSGVEVSLVNVMCREMVLKHFLQNVQTDYDYILIDCMPSLGILTVNVLAAANGVIIPVKAEKPSIRGLQQLLRTIGKVRRNMNPLLEIEGILPNMVDSRTNYNKGIVNALMEAYGGPLRIFNCIPQSIRMAETSAEGKSIYRHAGRENVAALYEKLVREVLSNE